jgi:hypothetical protein
MSADPMYHEGSRQLQDRFDSRRIADRLEEVTVQTALDESDKAFIQRSAFFFLATADDRGYPDCSYKGGLPGFVQVLDETTISFPDYDGNGMFRSLGNIQVNPHVGLLFIDFEKPKRLRVNGTATLHTDHPLLSDYPGAQLLVTVHVERAFPNCPRYLHKMQVVEYSTYTPRERYEPPEPDWKRMEVFRDALPHKSHRRDAESAENP